MIRRIMVAATMSSPFAVLFTLAASTIRSRDALQSEILALLTLTGRFLKTMRPNTFAQTLRPTVMGFVIAILVGCPRGLQIVQPERAVIGWYQRAFSDIGTRILRLQILHLQIGVFPVFPVGSFGPSERLT